MMFIIITIFVFFPLSECLRDPTENMTRQERIDFYNDLVSRQGELALDLTKVELWEASRREKLPKSFDARKAWPECKEIIGYVDNQGSCGGCWAYATASFISMRTCIESKGRTKFRHSYQDIVECAQPDGCAGTTKLQTGLDFFIISGVVSGGGLRSREGCKPVTDAVLNFDPRKSSLVSCQKKCSNIAYSKQYKDDKKFGYKYYYPGDVAEKLQNEIITHGPVLVSFDVFADFAAYEWDIYNNTRGLKIGGHAVVFIGWGEENNVPYWLAVNSWGDDWGDKGFFRILRGVNIGHIEEKALGIRVFKPERKKDVISSSISLTTWKILLLFVNLWNVIRCKVSQFLLNI